ncbi:MAG TPA: hypothetical protein VGN81_33855 [Pseudonocardiaceae bacterium]|jgi:hypothetical protein
MIDKLLCLGTMKQTLPDKSLALANRESAVGGIRMTEPIKIIGDQLLMSSGTVAGLVDKDPRPALAKQMRAIYLPIQQAEDPDNQPGFVVHLCTVYYAQQDWYTSGKYVIGIDPGQEQTGVAGAVRQLQRRQEAVRPRCADPRAATLADHRVVLGRERRGQDHGGQ